MSQRVATRSAGPGGGGTDVAGRPGATDPTRREAARSALLLLGALLGCAWAFLAIPAIFRSAPNDMERTATILGALGGSRGVLPRIVVFGDSISMSGFDGRHLRDELPGRPLVWNLASTGQTLYESLLLLDRLPATTTAIVLGIAPDLLGQEAPKIPDNKYAAYVMHGYRVGEDLERAAEEIGDPRFLAQIRQSGVRVRLAGRWVIRAGFDTWVRRLLRKDLDFGTAMNDLYFPPPFTTRASREALDRQMQRFHGPRPSFRTLPAVRSTLRAMGRMAAGRGRGLTVVLLPEHPRIRALSAPAFYDGMRAEVSSLERECGASFLDLHDLLGEEEFIDHLHLSSKGAGILTRAVAERLRAERR